MSRWIALVALVSQRRGFRSGKVLCAALAGVLMLGPPAFTFRQIDRYGVNVPFADDFTFAPVYAAAHAHTLTFTDLFAQHNEHRLFVPRLLAIGFAKYLHGDLRAEMVFSFVLCCLTAIALAELVSRTVPGTTLQRLFAIGCINLLLFSPVQAENWTWGFQFPVFLQNLLLVVSLLIATSSFSLPHKVWLCAALATVATFSFGNGALAWLVVFPVALLQTPWLTARQAVLWTTIWAAAAVTVIVSYLRGYTKPADSPSFANLTFGNGIVYLLKFLGGHIGRRADHANDVLPLLCGILLVALYVAAACIGWRHSSASDRNRALPWIALGGYGFTTGVITTFARAGFGTSQALSSRYTSFSIYLTIGLVGLLPILCTSLRAARIHRIYLTGGIILAGIVLLGASVASYSWGARKMQQTQITRLHGKAALLVANVLDSAAIYARDLSANASDARRFANALNRLGLIRPAMLSTNKVESLKIIPATQELCGYVETIRPTDASYEIEGWAILPATPRPADLIVLSSGSGAARSIFAVGQPTQRLDVARSLHDSHLLFAGWRASFPRDNVRGRRGPITAWAFDANRATFHELRNAVQQPE